MVKCMFFFFKQKAAYEMRMSDWSSDVCSSDLGGTLSPGTASANSRASVPSSDAGSGKGTDMNILLVGSGGREHADRKSVVWRQSVSVRVDLGGRRFIKHTNIVPTTKN